MSDKKTLIVVSIVFLLLFGLVGIAVHNSAEVEKSKTEFESILATVDQDVPDIMCLQLSDSSLIKDIEIDIRSSVEHVENYDFYNWTEYCKVIFYISDGFDTYRDSKQYQFIEDYGEQVYSLKAKAIHDLLPKHSAYTGYLTDENDALKEIYGKHVFYKPEYDVLFKTSSNTYQYSRRIDDYFVKNGKDHWVRSEVEKKSTPAPYVGMFESMISFTDLGKPTVVEKCIDFDLLKPSRRYKKYKWYENGIQDIQHLQAVATVSYNNTGTSGYVSDVILFN